MAGSDTRTQDSHVTAVVSRSWPWVVALLAVVHGSLRGRWASYRNLVLAYLAGVSTTPVAELLSVARRSYEVWVKSRTFCLGDKPSDPPMTVVQEGKLDMSVTKITAEWRKQIEAFRSVRTGTWTKIDSKRGTDRFFMQQEGSPICLVKGSTVINASFEVVVSLMCDFDLFADMMQICDEMNYERRIVERIDEHQGVFYGAFRLPAFLWNRDFAWRGSWAILPGREAVVLAKSTEHQDAPARESDRLVRGEISYSGYWIKELESGQVSVDYVVQADPKGNLPSWVVNIVAKDQADNITRLRDYCERMHASPPGEESSSAQRSASRRQTT